MQLGYIRVSSLLQNEIRQLDGIKLDKKFIDRCSGKTNDRPALRDLLEFAREGDTIVIHSIDRLARNLIDLKNIVEKATKKNIKIRFIKENLEFVGENSPIAKLMLNMIGSFAEFERDLIRERQLEGIAIAKQQGRYKGRKKSLNQEEIKKLMQRLNSGFYKNKTALAKEFNIDRTTLYLYAKKYANFFKEENNYQTDITDFVE